MSCVGALKNVYLSYGPKVLRDTLNTITAIWGQEDRAGLMGTMVNGVGEFLAEYRDVDFKRLREVVGAKYTPTQLQGAAKAYRSLHGGSASTSIKAMLVNTYNDRLRTKRHRLKPVSD
jgi:hypothetical protein